MPRRVQGVLCVEGVQTGDGRVIAEGALTWATLPLPLGWLMEEQHGDLLSGAVQIGTIDEITRGDNGEVNFVGTIDDGQPDGAEMVRRMESGTAPLGERWGISIDPDDWEMQIIATETEDSESEGGILILASARRPVLSGSGPLPAPPRPITAAAGDPDPGSEGGVVLYEDTVDSILQRFTRLRIRGATACAIAAFDGAFMSLDGEAEEAPAEAPAAVAAAASVVRPPASAFAIPEPLPGMTGQHEVYGGMPVEELLVEQPDGSLAVPLTITEPDEHGVRLVFGHAARWGQCHVGYPGDCVSPPESPSAYAHFHVGEVVTDDGTRVATGALTVGCDHAPITMRLGEARDHYANAGLGWADVRARNGDLGVWTCGVVRPGVSDEEVRVLRALSLSGDWRRSGTDLEFIAALSVNVPGFPIARESIYASAAPITTARVEDDVPISLVAAGQVYRCGDCQRRAALAAGGQVLDVAEDPRLDEVLTLVRRLDHRTRHLAVDAADHALSLIRQR